MDIDGIGGRLAPLKYRSPNNRQTCKPRSCDVGSVHLAFYVENIDALLAHIASVGWLPVGKVQTVQSGEREGLRLVYVRGPDGITVEFLQLPWGVAHQAEQYRGKRSKEEPSVD